MQVSQTALGRGANGTALRAKPFAPVSLSHSRGSLQVSNAITRQKKEDIVVNLKEKLDGSSVVFGVRFKGLSVATVQRFRKGLPETATMFVCKNNLMKVAVAESAWTMLADKGCTGENAWVFAPEDGMQATVKHYFQFEEALYNEAKKLARKDAVVAKPTELSVVVMDSKLLTPTELKAVEKLPTKKQLLATIAALVKQPATKLATSIKQVPLMLATAIKKVSELDEDKTKLVSSVVVTEASA